MEAFFEQRLAACDEAPGPSPPAGDGHLLPLVSSGGRACSGLRRLFQRAGPRPHRRASARSRRRAGSRSSAPRPPTASSRCSRATRASGSSSRSGSPSTGGSSAAPRRLLAAGVRLPARAVRGSRGRRHRGPVRRGIEEHLADAGFRFFFVDAHSAAPGARSASPAIRRAIPTVHAPLAASGLGSTQRSPYQAYRVAHGRAGDVAAYVRDPRASMQVWSRFEGYPGDEWYLEFHKMRWPGGLKLWRVSGAGVDLGDKQPYDPAAAAARARGHAESLRGPARRDRSGRSRQSRSGGRGAVRHRALRALVVRGPRLPGRRLSRARGAAQLRTPRHRLAHLDDIPPAPPSGCRRARGAPTATSACGSASRPPGPGSGSGRWRSASGTRRRPRCIERLRARRPGAGRPRAAAGPVLRLAVHHLDRRRGRLRRAALPGALRRCRRAGRRAGRRSRAALETAQGRAAELAQRDAIFPDVLPAVAAALGGSRSLVLG